MAQAIANRGPELLAVDITFLVTAIIANLLRCYTRIHMVKAFGLDDWLMAIATISFTAYASFSIAGVHYGTGRHHVDLERDNIDEAKNRWWYCYLFYCITMITSKLSIGYFLLRIAVRRLHAWVIYVAMFISVVAGSVFFFVTLFQCRPVSYFWNKDQPGQCVKVDVIIGLAYLYSVFSIISDFTFAILPVFLVMGLQLKLRTKMALIPLLAMGCIASSAVVARVPYLAKFDSPDFLWATVDIAIWSTVEQGLAITAGSLATLRPLFQEVTYRLGLGTNPTRLRPSNYSIESRPPGHALKSPHKSSQDGMHTYHLSSFAEAERSETDIADSSSGLRDKVTSWYRAPLSPLARSRRGSIMNMKKYSNDNESEKSLHAQSSKTSLDQDRMHIVVTQSFEVTDEQKG